MATIVKYWPAVVAGLYLAYVAAAGNATAVPGAIAALEHAGRERQRQRGPRQNLAVSLIQWMSIAEQTR